MGMPQLPESYKPKTFWERPEGTTGMITLGAAGLAAFFGLKLALPAILVVFAGLIDLAGKAIVLTGLGFVLFCLWWVLTNPKFWILMQYGFKSAMRKVTQIFVEIDPIGIMKNYIDDLKGMLNTMDRRIEDLAGRKRSLENLITSNEKERVQALKTFEQASKQNMAAQQTLNANKAKRLKDSNISLQEALNTLNLLYSGLQKYREAADVAIQDMEHDVKVKSKEREIILASHSAMRAAESILRGDGDRKELFDQAMEYVVDDYGRKLGEIQNFMTMSHSFVEGLDLSAGVANQEAMDQIKAWGSNADSLLLGESKRIMIETQHAPQTYEGSAVVIPSSSAQGADYAKLYR